MTDGKIPALRAGNQWIDRSIKLRKGPLGPTADHDDISRFGFDYAAWTFMNGEMITVVDAAGLVRGGFAPTEVFFVHNLLNDVAWDDRSIVQTQQGYAGLRCIAANDRGMVMIDHNSRFLAVYVPADRVAAIRATLERRARTVATPIVSSQPNGVTNAFNGETSSGGDMPIWIDKGIAVCTISAVTYYKALYQWLGENARPVVMMDARGARRGVLAPPALAAPLCERLGLDVVQNPKSAINTKFKCMRREAEQGRVFALGDSGRPLAYYMGPQWIDAILTQSGRTQPQAMANAALTFG